MLIVIGCQYFSPPITVVVTVALVLKAQHGYIFGRLTELQPYIQCWPCIQGYGN